MFSAGTRTTRAREDGVACVTSSGGPEGRLDNGDGNSPGRAARVGAFGATKVCRKNTGPSKSVRLFVIFSGCTFGGGEVLCGCGESACRRAQLIVVYVCVAFADRNGAAAAGGELAEEFKTFLFRVAQLVLPFRFFE